MCANHQPRCQDAPYCATPIPRPSFSIPNTGRGSILWRETQRRYRNKYGCFGGRMTVVLFMVVFLSWIFPTHATLVDFDNCLPDSIVDSEPPQLQFTPLHVDASFDIEGTVHPLSLTVYGNVSGTADKSPAPSADDPQWADPDSSLGKILDLNETNNKYTTLLTDLQILSFEAYSNAERFCPSVTQGSCPLGPLFYTNASNLTQLYAFSINHDMDSTYSFSTLSSTLSIKSGDASVTSLGCILVRLTPDLGTALKATFRYVPLAILVLVGVATMVAAIYSPWGSTDMFRWTTNYSRDEDILRLVTPGFADCLQYIQFVVLTGALSLNYPGYYQPVVSQAAWSSLMFNSSFVSDGDGRDPVVDGIYNVDGGYGLERLSHLVGMEASKDTWPGTIIWTLVVVGSVGVLAQLAFAFRCLHRRTGNITEEDRRVRNVPFTFGNVIRVVFNYLLLPVSSISLFQLVVAPESPAYSVALACVVIVILILFILWAIRLIATTRPRALLFDEPSKVLLYGTFYNNFRESSVVFAAVPLVLNFIRGIAVGAVQPSGVAQIVLLAICEVVFILTIITFRPFPRSTSMNVYHVIFSSVRFVCVLLSVSFVPALNVEESTRGWVGYVIFVLHALVFVFGFFLNAVQTLVEVLARLAGAGDYDGRATRGGLAEVLGKRQLSRRVSRRRVRRHNLSSEDAMLAQTDGLVSHSRSVSGSSTLLFPRRTATTDDRPSLGLESGTGTHSRTDSLGLYGSTTLGSGTMPAAGAKAAGSTSPPSKQMAMVSPDPYYRPPRPRKRTVGAVNTQDIGEASSGNQRNPTSTDDDAEDGADAPLVSDDASPTPAYLGAPKDDLEDDDDTRQRPPQDYAVREVDFYYNARGPPIPHSGTRRMKTGPSDPSGPVSAATSWLRNIFSGKTKEKGKGFEVVRSGRAPPPPPGPLEEGVAFHEPYRDDPDEQGHRSPHSRQGSLGPYRDSNGDEEEGAENRGSRAAYTLPPVDVGGGIELPSRMGSQVSTHTPTNNNNDNVPDAAVAPAVPRKSSKRQSAHVQPSPREEDETSHSAAAAKSESVEDSNGNGNGNGSSNNNESGPGSGSEGVTRSASTRLNPTTTGRLPFDTTTTNSGHATAGRNLSVASTNASTSSDGRGQHHHYHHQDDRPSTVGFVPQHRASDNIHEANAEQRSFTGTVAEFVEDVTPTTESGRSPTTESGRSLTPTP